MRGCIGSLDGLHVSIRAPNVQDGLYNVKAFYSGEKVEIARERDYVPLREFVKRCSFPQCRHYWGEIEFCPDERCNGESNSFFTSTRISFSLTKFEGHYMDYGINVQGVSDEKGRFIYFAVAAPGSMHDSKAYQETTPPSLVKNLPPNVFIVADNAYTPTEHLIPVYGGIERAQIGKDDTNYFISQVRIHIERAFGIMKHVDTVIHHSIFSSR